MERIGLGLIGSGMMGMAHTYGFAIAERVFNLPYQIDYTLLADATPELAETARQRFGFTRATADWRALVADSAVDIVDITAPNAMHKEIALTALSAGKHVYCEKPLAPTSADTAEMFAATRGAGVVTQVGFNYLCNPIMLLARDMIASGELGDIVGYHGIHAEEYMMDREKPWSFRFEPAGGGALADIGSHALATAEFLLGPIAKVFGDCRTIYPTRPGPDGAPREVVIDDLTNALIEFERGCCGTITANWLAAGETMSHDFKVIGSKGAITFTQERLNEMRYHSADDPAGRRGFRTIVAGPDHPPYANFCIAPGHQIGFNEMKAIEVKGFLDAIAGDINEPFGFDKGHRIQLIVDTIRASSNAKAWMPIPAAA